MNNKQNLLRGLAATVGGAFLSVIGPDLLRLFWPPATFDEKTLLSNTLIFITFFGSLLFIFIGLGLSQSMCRSLLLLLRRICTSIGWYRIGILYDERVMRVCTHISPDEWRTLLQTAARKFNKRVSITLLNPVKDYTVYNVIVNPYGGNYPETDSAAYPIYNKILEYMQEGGSFVNVADLPMYWAYNAARRQTINRIPPTYLMQGNNIYPLRIFQEAPLTRELSLQIETSVNNQLPFILRSPYDRCSEPNCNVYSPDRVVLIERHNVETIIDPIRVSPQDHRTPFFICGYGKGCCLISLFWLDQAINRPIAPVIANVVVDQLLGNLRR